MVHQGHQHELPKLDPEADIPTIQLVGPQTSRREIESLYYEVYKLWRLPRVPTWRARTCGRGGVLLWRPPRVGMKGNTTDVRAATGNGAQGHLLPPGVGQEFGGGEHEGTLPCTPNRRDTEVGDLEGSNVQNTQLVEGADSGVWGGWPWKVGMQGTGLFSTPEYGEQTMPGEEQPSGSACTTVPSSDKLLATTRFHLYLLGYPGNTVWEDGGIHQGPSVLGGEGQSADWRSTMPFGGEHERALERNGMLPLLLQWGCIPRHGSSRRNPCHSTQGGHTPEHPASTNWHPYEESHHGAHCREEASKPVPCLGESAAPLQVHSCHWRNSSLIKRHEMKVPLSEFRRRTHLATSN